MPFLYSFFRKMGFRYFTVLVLLGLALADAKSLKGKRALLDIAKCVQSPRVIKVIATTEMNITQGALIFFMCSRTHMLSLACKVCDFKFRRGLFLLRLVRLKKLIFYSLAKSG